MAIHNRATHKRSIHNRATHNNVPKSHSTDRRKNRPTRHTIGAFVVLFCLPLLLLMVMHGLAPAPTSALANRSSNTGVTIPDTTIPDATLAALPSQSSTLTYYVATNGDDRQDGSQSHPWATLNHAAATVEAGDTVYIRGGIYSLAQQIRLQHSGTGDRPITYAAAPGEHVILDAQHIAVAAPSGNPPFAHDQGAFQIENVSHIRVRDLEITNSHNAGITVRHSDHVQIYNDTINPTFS